MSEKRREELYDIIPSYPGGCSKELLAAKSGYIKAPFTKESIRRGIKAMEKDLAWLTIRDQTIVQRHFPMQKTTLSALQSYGVAGYDVEDTIYISRDYQGGDK